jgi:hypothetical protein
MTLIATGLAAALIAAASFVPEGTDASAASPSPTPPVAINVLVAPEVSAALVSRILAETSAIWRSGGFEFVWQRVAREALPFASLPEAGPRGSSPLRVVIGDSKGVARDSRTPLGWIVFDDEHEPQPEIYLSWMNARSLMEAARQVVGVAAHMPSTQRELLLGRALGRALAHELGHYLLASKVHTKGGLMKASRTAAELFGTASHGFQLDQSQRRMVAARMRGESFVASR